MIQTATHPLNSRISTRFLTFTEAEEALPAVVGDAFQLAGKSRDAAELQSLMVTSRFHAGLKDLTSSKYGSALEHVAQKMGAEPSVVRNDHLMGCRLNDAVRQATVDALSHGLMAGALDGAVMWAAQQTAASVEGRGEFRPDPSLKRLEALSADDLNTRARSGIDSALERAEKHPLDFNVTYGMSQTDYKKALEEHYEYGYIVGSAGAALHNRGLAVERPSDC